MLIRSKDHRNIGTAKRELSQGMLRAKSSRPVGTGTGGVWEYKGKGV